VCAFTRIKRTRVYGKTTDGRVGRARACINILLFSYCVRTRVIMNVRYMLYYYYYYYYLYEYTARGNNVVRKHRARERTVRLTITSLFSLSLTLSRTRVYIHTVLFRNICSRARRRFLNHNNNSILYSLGVFFFSPFFHIYIYTPSIKHFASSL